MNDFIARMTEISGLSQAWFLMAFLVFLRVGAMMALLPAFGEQSVPARVRLALALAFTAIVFPAVAGSIPPASGPLPFLAEVIIGLLLGIGLRLFIHALQMAGVMIAQATSLSQTFPALDSEPLPSIGTILTVAGLALAMAMGLHVRAAELMILSYDLLPVAVIPNPAQVAAWGLAQVAHVFALAFSLAAPFLIASLIYNLATGVINRAMPQLMVSMVGAPAITLGGLALMAIAAPLLLSVWAQALNAWFTDPFQVP